MYIDVLFRYPDVRVPGPVVSPLKTSCACDDEQPRRAQHGKTKWTDRIHSREGGGAGGATYLFLGGYVCRTTLNCDP